MAKVHVVDLENSVLEPCHPGKARMLLKTGKATVNHKYGLFGIRLNRVVPSEHIVTTEHTFGYDPGSRQSGAAIANRASGEMEVLAEVHHRGPQIKKKLSERAGFRRGRRTRNCRYREPRFLNRSRKTPVIVRAGDELKIECLKVLNTRKKQTEFNRVSNAMLKDPRYTWRHRVTIDGKEEWVPAEDAHKYDKPKGDSRPLTPRYADGRKLRDGDKYFEIDGQRYRYKEKRHKAQGLKPETYEAKPTRQRKRWKRTVKKDVAKAEKKRIQAWREKRGLEEATGPENAPWSNGWIAPSLVSRLWNLVTLLNRWRKLYPITHLTVENVKFDMQLLENPNIHGEKYQQGVGKRNMRAYLLERTQGKCFLCGNRGGLTIAHLIPDSREGRFEKGNLSMACRPCQIKMSNIHPTKEADKLKKAVGEKDYAKIKKEMRNAKKSLKDTAAVNSIRFKVVEVLKAAGLPVELVHGGETAFRRDKIGLPKRHYYDAAVVAGATQRPTKDTPVHIIKAEGYGHRGDLGGRQFYMKAPGFIRETAKRPESCGFQVKDEVEFVMSRKGIKIRGIIDGFNKTEKRKPRKLQVIPNGCYCSRSLRKTLAQKENSYDYPFEYTAEKKSDVSKIRLIRRRDGYRYHTIPASREFRNPKPIAIPTNQTKVQPKYTVKDINVIEQLFLF